MAIPSIYLNLEDDISRIVPRLSHQTSREIILVCPKRCVLFSDPENLKKLKAYGDSLGKRIFILTMDERGQAYARAAGLGLRTLPKTRPQSAWSDVRISKPEAVTQLERDLETKTTIA